MAWTDMTAGILSQSTTTFGRPVVYTAASGDVFPIRGIFETVPTDAEMGHGIVVNATRPALGIQLSDLPMEPGKNDTVTVDSIIYRVISSEPDGNGGTTLRLQKK